MNRPRPYYVSHADSTPEEHGPGWFWVEFTERDGPDLVHGPFDSRRLAEDSIDSFVFECGGIP